MFFRSRNSTSIHYFKANHETDTRYVEVKLLLCEHLRQHISHLSILTNIEWSFDHCCCHHVFLLFLHFFFCSFLPLMPYLLRLFVVFVFLFIIFFFFVFSSLALSSSSSSSLTLAFSSSSSSSFYSLYSSWISTFSDTSSFKFHFFKVVGLWKTTLWEVPDIPATTQRIWIAFIEFIFLLIRNYSFLSFILTWKGIPRACEYKIITQ